MGVRLDGKVVMVTGAASGIGKATAIAAGKAGAKVVVADRDDAGAAATLASIEEAGGEGMSVQVDVSKEADVKALMNQVAVKFGRLDSAANIAGIQGLLADTADCTEENWDQIISVNLKGIWLCMKHEIQLMLRGGGGRIVNIGSNFSLVAGPGMTAYSASKHGVIGLTKTAAIEYCTKGIFVNAVLPGPTHTSLGEKLQAAQPEEIALLYERSKWRMPTGDLAAPEDIAEAIIWCCSDSSRYMVGSVVAVDGGFSAL